MFSRFQDPHSKWYISYVACIIGSRQTNECRSSKESSLFPIISPFNTSYRYSTLHKILKDWWLNGSTPDCKNAVPGSNPASLQPAGTGQFLAWHGNCTSFSEGRQRQKNTKITTTTNLAPKTALKTWWVRQTGSKNNNFSHL